jgi:hypothetical protein
MILLTIKSCAFEGCPRCPSFNLSGEKPKYCATHKTPDMIDVVTKKCIFKDCLIKASFNFECEKSPLFCSKHKACGMINIIKKKCDYEGCSKKTGYYINFCPTHRPEDKISNKRIKITHNEESV